MSRLILCTVGVSLEEKCRQGNLLENDLTLYNPIFGNNGVICKYNSNEVINLQNDVLDHINALLKKYQNFWWQSNNERDKRQASPAELASLSGQLFNRDQAPNLQSCVGGQESVHAANSQLEDVVVLLCSNTPKGVFCGLFIKEFIGQMGWASCGLRAKFAQGNLTIIPSENTSPDTSSISVCGNNTNEQAVGQLLSCGGLVMVDGLAIEDNRQFEEIGLANLASCMSLFIKSALDKEMEVEVNATGGFKPQSIYATVIGSLFEVDVYYLHEDSQENLKLPHLPIDHDVMSWAEYMGIIEAIDGREEAISAALRGSLPEPYARLFQKRGESLFLNPFGSIVRDRMKEETRRVSRYGRGLLLTERLGEYKEEYERCVTDKWQYLWLGDLIPETVEHARGHTQRLLTLASQLLLPLYGSCGNPLDEKSLFALLASIWLHDLGHKQRELKVPSEEEFAVPGNPKSPFAIDDWEPFSLSGLPTAVRDMHHVLTWEALLLDGSCRYGLKEYLIYPVAWPCLFHRFKMPLSGTGDFVDSATGFSVKGPLAKEMSGVKTQVVAALLRFLDACDVQRERTVDERYLIERMDLTSMEMEEEKGRLMEFAESFKNAECCIKDLNNNLFEFLGAATELNESLINFMSKNGGSNRDLSMVNFDGLKSGLQQSLDELIKSNKNLFLDCNSERKLLFRSWLESADRAFFKALQGYHFFKHCQISQVLILPDNNGNFQIHLRPADNHIDKMVENIKRDIEGECGKVNGILKQLGINRVNVVANQNQWEARNG